MTMIKVFQGGLNSSSLKTVSAQSALLKFLVAFTAELFLDEGGKTGIKRPQVPAFIPNHLHQVLEICLKRKTSLQVYQFKELRKKAECMKTEDIISRAVTSATFSTFLKPFLT